MLVAMPKPKPITAKELEAIRTALGKTQAEMAEMYGVTLRTYSRWASGNATIPLVVALAARSLTKKS